MKLRIQVGENPNESFKLFLGDEDITDRIDVKSMTLAVDWKTKSTIVNLECYPGNLEILAAAVNVNIVENDNVGK